MPVIVDVSEFQPVIEELELYGPSGDPIETDEDLWVRLIPPTHRADRERGQFLKYAYSSDGVTSTGNPRVREGLEIWLTFGGTNLSVLLPKTDDDGVVYDEEGHPKMEEITFPETRGEITRSEFLDKLDRLPDFIVTSWHNLVINKVARSWASPF